MNILERPLTTTEIRANLNEAGMVSGLVLVDVSDLIDRDLEGVLDLLSERLIGSSVGMEIDYTAITIQDGSIVMEVTLNPEAVLEDDDREQEL